MELLYRSSFAGAYTRVHADGAFSSSHRGDRLSAERVFVRGGSIPRFLSWVILGAILAASMVDGYTDPLSLSVLSVSGAFLFALLGYYLIHVLEVRWRIRTDSALCFVLSLFFGIGILLASYVQFSNSSIYKQSLSYLYGQAATMNDKHVALYGVLSFVVAGMIFAFYKEIKVLTFDRDYAHAIGLRVHLVDMAVLIFLSLSIVVGIRSVGVVLMSAMLIAPAAAARQYTHRLSYMLLLAGTFGVISGFLGNFFSIELSTYLSRLYPSERLSLPTGPMIVMVASIICVVSLLLLPKGGSVSDWLESAFFALVACVKIF